MKIKLCCVYSKEKYRKLIEMENQALELVKNNNKLTIKSILKPIIESSRVFHYDNESNLCIICKYCIKSIILRSHDCN